MEDNKEELIRLPNPDIEAYQVLREIGVPRLSIYREDLRAKGHGDLRGTEGPGARLLNRADGEAPLIAVLTPEKRALRAVEQLGARMRADVEHAADHTNDDDHER